MKTKHSGCLAVLVLVVVVAAAAGQDKRYECQQMRGECRVAVKEEEGDDGLVTVTRNISCYCNKGLDVYRQLDQVSGVTCMRAGGRYVNTSVLHIVGCAVSQLFPRSLLATCRQSSTLSLYIERSPWVSLGSPKPDLDPSTAPDTITATFINSNVSGIPAGVVGGAGVLAEVRVDGGEMGVVETNAFSGYPSDAHVYVTITHTKILTVKQGAFDLPPVSVVSITGGKILNLERHSFSGGSALVLRGAALAKVLAFAFNIYGLRTFNMTDCKVANVYADAVEHRIPTYERVVEGGKRVLGGSEAVFVNNSFMEGNGQAFAQLCTVEWLTWTNNTMLTTSDMPMRLQGPDCSTRRDWGRVFSINALSCLHCNDFINPDQQTCALYQSGHCIYCDEPMDQCYKPILPYITDKCRISHPDLAANLTKTCTAAATANPRARKSKALKVEGNGNAASVCPASFLLVLAQVATLSMLSRREQ